VIALALAAALTQPDILKEDRIQGVWAQDVDGDGKLELLVQVGRRLDLHAGLRAEPAETLLMDQDPFVWTLCRLEGTRGLSVAVLTSRGLWFYRRGADGWAREPEPAVVHPNLFHGKLALREAPARLEFMPRLNGDEAADLIYPGVEATFVMVQRAGSFVLRQKILLAMEFSGELGWWPRPEVRETVRVPFLYAADLDGDGLSDLAAFDGEKLAAFHQDADGSFPNAPDRTLRLPSPRAKSFFKIRPSPSVQDVDGDGQADLVQVNPAIGAAEIYYGRDGMPSNADVEQREDGGTWGISARVAPMGPSGRRALVLQTVEQVGLLEAVEFLKKRRAELRVSFYPLEASGRPARNAARTLRLDAPFVADVTQYGFDLKRIQEPVLADLDGDGARDCVAVTAEGRLARYGADGDGSVRDEPEPLGGFKLPDGAADVRMQAADLDGDGRDDLIVICAVRGGGERIMVRWSNAK
jgi:hypothetical protein